MFAKSKRLRAVGLELSHLLLDLYQVKQFHSGSLQRLMDKVEHLMIKSAFSFDMYDLGQKIRSFIFSLIAYQISTIIMKNYL